MRVTVVDCGSGNLRSVAKALERAAGERGIDAQVRVSAVAEDVAAADRVVLPGVGAFAACRRALAAIPDMQETLTSAARERPFLGICVGMQVMASVGREHEPCPGLDWLPGEVVKVAPPPGGKVPHMGWNTLSMVRPHPVLAGMEGAHVYFVHGYRFEAQQEDVLARTDYGDGVVAAVGRGSMVGVQFHPEKSQKTGLAILGNFLGWSP